MLVTVQLSHVVKTIHHILGHISEIVFGAQSLTIHVNIFIMYFCVYDLAHVCLSLCGYVLVHVLMILLK